MKRSMGNAIVKPLALIGPFQHASKSPLPPFFYDDSTRCFETDQSRRVRSGIHRANKQEQVRCNGSTVKARDCLPPVRPAQPVRLSLKKKQQQ